MSKEDKENFSSGTSIAIEADSEIKEPSLFQVLLLNDHYTSMEFVVFILETIFSKPRLEAEQIMLSVHNTGSGIAGIYVKEIAETKIQEVHSLAAKNEFPLKCKMLEA